MLITRAAPIFFKMLFSFNECKEIINLIANFLLLLSIKKTGSTSGPFAICRKFSSAMSTDYSQSN